LIFDTVKFLVWYIKFSLLALSVVLLLPHSINAQTVSTSKKEIQPTSQYRHRINLNNGWKFMRYKTEPDKLIYDERPKVGSRNDNIVADTRATDSVQATSSANSLKKWILPSANNFISDSH